MDKPSSLSVRVIIAAISILVALAAIALLIVLVLTVRSSTIPFDNDEANHAIDGWEVYDAIGNLAPGDFYRAVTNQGFYPPVNSFFVAAAYLLVGPSLASSRLPTVLNFALTLLLLAWLTFRIASQDSKRGSSDAWLALVGATFAIALAITSEIFVVNAVLTMLEITGALFGLLLLLVADRIDVMPGATVYHGRLLGRERPGDSSAGFESRMTNRPSTRWIGLSAAAVVATLIFLTKYSFGLFYLPGLVGALVTATKPWKAGRRAWLEAGHVIAVYLVVIGMWVAVADRETMGLFFVDHPQYAPILSTENLFFLPRVWFEHYSSTEALAAITVLLALIGAWHRWQRLSVRVASWSILAAIVVLTISPTDELRHFLPLAPAIWMLAALGLVEVLLWLQGRSRGAIEVVTVLIVLFALIVGGAISPALCLQARLIQELEGIPAYAALQDFALQQVDLGRPILFIGELNDQNGLLAIRWRSATLAHKSLWDLDIDYFPFEDREHSLRRTHRKPQIATVDPTFPRGQLNEVLDRNYYAYVIEIRRLDSNSDLRSGNPKDPLCGYHAIERRFEDWAAIVYDVSAESETNSCWVGP